MQTLKTKQNDAAYRTLTEAFKKQRRGATVADMVAATALPLAEVRELVPAVADEYSARLEVTESGEIRYSFPHGFVSRYRGFRAGLKRFSGVFLSGLKRAGAALFKVWIMVMLLGYFAFFMLIALASLLLSLAGSSSDSRSRDSGGGFFLASSIFNMIIRIWFYSELTKSLDGRYRDPLRAQKQKKSRPLHKAIFSFVFGDGDPNAAWEEREKKAVIAYVQANRGVISLPEFMTLTGLKPAEAETALMAYCSRFGGSPEATDGGTIVYRFDELLLRADTQDRSFAGAALLKRLKIFSSNEKKMNGIFAAINGINLLFGGYFLWNALDTGAILTQAQFNASSFLYGFSYVLLTHVVSDPLPFLTIGMGFVPLAFSIVFWLIPAMRGLSLKTENEAIKTENLRRIGYGRIWDRLRNLKDSDIEGAAAECRPVDLKTAQDKIIKEMGSYSQPEVAVENGSPLYSFPELEREKEELEKYRSNVDLSASRLGKTVFDSGE